MERSTDGFVERLEWIIGNVFDGSAAELARASNCATSTVSGWRNSGHIPARQRIRALARAARVHEEWLAHGTGPREVAAEVPPPPVRLDGGFASMTDEAKVHALKLSVPENRQTRARNAIRLLRVFDEKLGSIYEALGVPLTMEQVNAVTERFLDVVNEFEIKTGTPLSGHEELGKLLVELVTTAHQDAVGWTVRQLAAPRRKRRGGGARIKVGGK